MLAGGLILSTLDTQLPDRLSVEMTILEERACFNRGLLTTGRDLLGDGYAFGRVEWHPSGYTADVAAEGDRRGGCA